MSAAAFVAAAAVAAAARTEFSALIVVRISLLADIVPMTTCIASHFVAPRLFVCLLFSYGAQHAFAKDRVAELFHGVVALRAA